MNYKKILNLTLVILPVVLMFPVAYLTQASDDLLHRMIILLLMLFVDLIMAGYLYLSKKVMNFNQQIFLTMVIAAIGSIAFMIREASYLYVPILVAVMLISMIVDSQVAIVMHIGLTLTIALVVGHGSIFIIYYMLIGIVTALTVNYAKERNKMLLVVGCLALFSGLLHTSLTYKLYGSVNFVELLLALGNSALSLILVIGSLPLWESIFKVMTPLKLLEIANSDHKLMQRLLLEAPGTYHHVQMVGNLAERGAKSIGADSILAKTGAVFHDVGKLKEPIYFIENQNGGPNPHDDIAADASARIIIEHVSFGVKLAQEHKLPTVIVDIIQEHHGTSLVGYFYHKAQNYNDGVSYSEETFRYDGPKPQSKESAIVMLADCIEAYVRSLNEDHRTLDRIEQIIKEITHQKFEDGQLNECSLQVSELKIIGEAFMQVYNGLYHERIEYPGKVDV